MKKKKIELLKALAFPVSAWFVLAVGTTVVQAEEQSSEPQTSDVISVSENAKEELQSVSEVNAVEENVNSISTQTNEELSYSTHVQDQGWQAEKSDGETSGTVGSSKRLEAISIQLDNQSDYSGDIEYQTHVQDVGWQDWKSNGEIAGTVGQSKRLEAIRIQLTDQWSQLYNVLYRVHCQDYGWMEWVQNGEIAGTVGLSKRLEAIEIKLIKKAETEPSVTYKSHIQDTGWEVVSKQDGDTSGTTGQSKRLEAIEITLNDSKYAGDILYRTHVQNLGWEGAWSSKGSLSGTTNQSLRLEAIQIKLSGELANYYDVVYRVHAQDYGWLGWAKNGESAGTQGLSYRLEGIEIKLVKKGLYVATNELSFIKSSLDFIYASHISNQGWQSAVSAGNTSGTTGTGENIESIVINASDSDFLSTLLKKGLTYRVHVDNSGWLDWTSVNSSTGTTGQSKAIQAIEMKLSSVLSKYYDVYYRAHIADYGWLDWAKDGAVSGSTGLSKGLQAFQIKIVAKKASAPTSSSTVASIQSYKGYNKNGQVLTGWQTVNESTQIHFDSFGNLSINTVVDNKTLNSDGFISSNSYTWNGTKLTAAMGVNYGPSGKETYYNMDMSGVISIMRSIGNNDTYWVRSDGVKMLGDYVMIAANLSLRPRGSLVPTSLGMGIVCDTGGFAYSNPTQVDIAVTW